MRKNRQSLSYKVLHRINLLRLRIVNSIYDNRLSNWYKSTDYPDEIKKFKGIHDGERCFIIGNGPSLTAKDLDLIKDEYSFSCNKIYKIYNQTIWRPYYYVVDDRGFVSKDYENIISTVKAKAKFVGVEFEMNLAKPFLNSDVILLKEKTILNDNRPAWNLDIHDYICAGHTVTFPMVQIAIYMGFKELYLIGNDCSYLATLENDTIAKNHFYEDDDDRTSERDAYNLFYAFESIKKCAEQNGVKVFNATRGGALEIFERVDLESVINNGKHE